MNEWENEPDNVQWKAKNGFPCCIIRHTRGSGHLCGYVGIPSNHPFFEKHYDDDALNNIEVHGGLTFANNIDEAKSGYEKGSLWWFGFDCAHLGDFVLNLT